MNEKNEIYFASKRDLKPWLFVWIFIIAVTWLMLSQKVYVHIITIILAAVFGAAVVFVGWIFLATGYRIAQKELFISNGPFRYIIALSEIKAIKNTRNPKSSPANSIDRLEISYGDAKTILISPADQLNFIKTILTKAPHIAVNQTVRQ